MRTFRRICVYGGSSDDVPAVFREAARALGASLVRRGVDLVFGGGRVGLMGEIAGAVLSLGGRVYGVIPERLQSLELGHPGCTELFVVDSMHARKMMMAQLSDAFVALPGGWGTLEELFEVTTWTQLSFHEKPVGILNVGGYYDPLLQWVARAAAEGFIRPHHRDLLVAAAEPDALVDLLAGAELPRLPKWMVRP